MERLELLSSRDVETTAFVKPCGLSSYVHIARAIARRCERKAVAAKNSQLIKQDHIIALNRISDILFIEALDTQIEEVSYFGTNNNPNSSAGS